MLPTATTHEAAAPAEPKQDSAVQPPSEDRRSRHKPKKMWEVCHFNNHVLIFLPSMDFSTWYLLLMSKM